MPPVCWVKVEFIHWEFSVWRKSASRIVIAWHETSGLVLDWSFPQLENCYTWWIQSWCRVLCFTAPKKASPGRRGPQETPRTRRTREPGTGRWPHFQIGERGGGLPESWLLQPDDERLRWRQRSDAPGLWLRCLEN